MWYQVRNSGLKRFSVGYLMHRRPPVGKSVLYLVIVLGVIAVIAGILLIVVYRPGIRVEDILTVYQDDGQYSGLSILYPLNETLFPPEIVPPVFRWKEVQTGKIGYRLC